MAKLIVTIETKWPRDREAFERIAIHALREAANTREALVDVGPNCNDVITFVDMRGDDRFSVRMTVSELPVTP